MIIADLNEFHFFINAVEYRDATEKDGTNHPVVILRATYSNNHVDIKYVQQLHVARQAGLLIGHYGYMVAGVDAAVQGTFFGNVVKANGGLLPGDTIACDCEEGSGDQAPRIEAFLAAAHAVLHDNPADEEAYSGAYFWKAHIGTVVVNGVTVHRWIAAYGQSDPNLGEVIWQLADNWVFPGTSGNEQCDGNRFNGTLNQYKVVMGVTAPTSEPSNARTVNKPPVGPLVYLPGGTANDYWQVCSDGGVFNFGAAGFYGSAAGKPLNAPAVGMAATKTGKGYWIACADGGVFNYGDAAFDGSEGGTKLNKPIIGITTSPDGNGYILQAEDGGLFPFGDATLNGHVSYTG